jgi:uncharacterized protein YjbI with pentapeptide repeats
MSQKRTIQVLSQTYTPHIFALAALLAACDQTVSTSLVQPITTSQISAFASDAACGDEPSWGEENASTRPACPGQTVVASLRQDHVVRIPLQVPTKLPVTYCFRDDNGEAHRAEIWPSRTENEEAEQAPVVQLRAGEACLSRELDPGRYELRIFHSQPLDSASNDVERTDTTPDIIHTQLIVSGAEPSPESRIAQQARGLSLRTLAGSTSTPEVVYDISVNDCPKCNITNVALPFLYKDSLGRTHAGYSGNYRDAVLTSLFCRADICELGSSVAADNIDFRGARIEFFGGDGSRLVSVGSTIPGKTGTPNDRFQGAQISFRASRQNSVALLLNNLSGARFSDTIRSISTGVNAGNVRGDFKSLTVVAPESSFFRNVETDELTVQHLRAQKVIVEDNVVRVTQQAPLAGLVVNGTGNRYVFGSGDPLNRYVDARRIDFSGATLRNLRFGCGADAGSSFVGSLWTEAKLENVDLSECDLEGISMPRVEMRDVTARRANLRNGTLWLSGSSASIDLSRSNLERLQVVEAFGSLFAQSTEVIKDLSIASSLARGARFGMLRQKLVIESKVAVDLGAFPGKPIKLSGFVATNADLTDASFESADLSAANFRGAALDGTLFAGANLSGAKLSSARGIATDFSSTNLRNAQMDASVWNQGVFNASDMSGATFQSGLVCGGALADAKLIGTNLSGTLVATQSNIFLRNGLNVVCSETFGWDTTQTDSTSRCPDGGNGRCSGQKRWLPIGNPPVCCDPFDDDDCPSRSSVGQACQNACECASLKCVGGRCG